MKTISKLAFSIVVLLAGLTPLLAWEVKDLTGRYELTGVMEMAGGLAIKADGTYTAGFSYGAADWIEEGSWKPEGDGLVLSGSRFKARNTKEIPLFLPSGTRFVYKDGRLTATGPGGKVTFVDPNKTPSRRNKTGEAGEGRMIVKGKVVRLDSESLVVQQGRECIVFDAARLSPDILKSAKQGSKIDAEIPYSSIIGGESCPE
ncbi:MAG TPA: hypothetical protein VLJ37_08790 [bacterium]|nr:hypothetical protein [bacterium]